MHKGLFNLPILVTCVILLILNDNNVHCRPQQGAPNPYSASAVPQVGMGTLANFMKEYFSSYSPQKTRTYTLYGNGVGVFPVDQNAGLPAAPNTAGPVRTIVQSSSAPGQKPSVVTEPATDFGWQPSSRDPYSYLQNSFQGRSDNSEYVNDDIITAFNVHTHEGHDHDDPDDKEESHLRKRSHEEKEEPIREFKVESGMSF